VLITALAGLAVPAHAVFADDDDDPAPAPDPVVTTVGAGDDAQDPLATAVRLGDVRIDPKIPGRVRVDVAYRCSIADEARSLTVSLEQKDPEDTSSVAFGSARTPEAEVICDGEQQHRQLVVQSKTMNWVPDADAVVIATVSNVGASPSASSEASRVRLVAP
ncbi:hypothetical protein, partial [Streptomyces sp. FH025]|uniref:hypothetical protein n=1 Tax=Streptomyces sp. FH025 TaxID=2815937 RepID=UPI001A9DF17D